MEAAEIMSKHMLALGAVTFISIGLTRANAEAPCPRNAT